MKTKILNVLRIICYILAIPACLALGCGMIGLVMWAETEHGDGISIQEPETYNSGDWLWFGYYYGGTVEDKIVISKESGIIESGGTFYLPIINNTASYKVDRNHKLILSDISFNGSSMTCTIINRYGKDAQ